MAAVLQVVKQNAPYFQHMENDNAVVGVLNPGSLIDVLETKMDSKGRCKVHHTLGWTPTHAPDGTAVLAPYADAPTPLVFGDDVGATVAPTTEQLVEAELKRGAVSGDVEPIGAPPEPDGPPGPPPVVAGASGPPAPATWGGMQAVTSPAANRIMAPGMARWSHA
eukprot:SAG31_NODE_1677_length_7533_cov_2.288054_8_plen_165_part_00